MPICCQPAHHQRPGAAASDGHWNRNHVVTDLAGKLDRRHASVIKQPLQFCGRGGGNELERQCDDQDTQELLKTLDLHPPRQQTAAGFHQPHQNQPGDQKQRRGHVIFALGKLTRLAHQVHFHSHMAQLREIPVDAERRDVGIRVGRTEQPCDDEQADQAEPKRDELADE